MRYHINLMFRFFLPALCGIFLSFHGGMLYAADSEISSVPRAPDASAAVPSAVPPAAASVVVPSASFREIWGYLQVGDENLIDPSYPVSDIGYFSAGINYRGKLVGVPDRKRLSKFGGRVHLVIAEISNQALMHFCLDPSYRIRDELISSIAAAAGDYDGIQIDFELVPASDKDAFVDFLTVLKKKLGQKTLSVAMPARTRNVGDAFDYELISRIADRIIVMAYDEHWSGSSPGSIASLEWCRKVASYALSIIPSEKLVMGLPFYGRAWAEKNPSKAYLFSGISRLINEKNIGTINREDSVPSFSYQETVTVNVFFEDSCSLLSRATLYRDANVGAIAFWRIGQEDKSIWSKLALSTAVPPVQ